jgi:thiosulfate reductase cytochrome b subunit
MKPLQTPKNSTSFALWLLLVSGIKGYTSYDAVSDEHFFKFSTRVSDLIRDHNLAVHKKLEHGKNRFNHSYTNTRYCLYVNDKKKNIELYNKINVAK